GLGAEAGVLADPVARDVLVRGGQGGDGLEDLPVDMGMDAGGGPGVGGLGLDLVEGLDTGVELGRGVVGQPLIQVDGPQAGVAGVAPDAYGELVLAVGEVGVAAVDEEPLAEEAARGGVSEVTELRRAGARV